MPSRQFLILKRHFDVSPANVYRAWSDPSQLRNWWGPDEDDKNILVDTDVRVGGVYHIVTKAANGDRYNFTGEYREVVPDKKLSFTWNTGVEEEGSIVTAEVEDNGAGTTLTVTHEGLSNADEREGCEHSWQGALQKLRRFVSN